MRYAHLRTVREIHRSPQGAGRGEEEDEVMRYSDKRMVGDVTVIMVMKTVGNRSMSGYLSRFYDNKNFEVKGERPTSRNVMRFYGQKGHENACHVANLLRADGFSATVFHFPHGCDVVT